jgi:hypothetical protein
VLQAHILWVWLLNAALIAAVTILFIHWQCIPWIVGDGIISALLQVAAIAGVAYEAVFGIFFLGIPSHAKRAAELHAKGGQWYMLLTFGVPFLVLVYFGSLTAMTTLNTPLVNDYLLRHVHEVFSSADTEEPRGVITYFEFQNYVNSDPTYTDVQASSDFRMMLQHMFDEIDTDEDGFIDREAVYNGLQLWLLPIRQTFAIASGAVAGLILLYILSFRLIFVTKYPNEYRSFSSDKVHSEYEHDDASDHSSDAFNDASDSEDST